MSEQIPRPNFTSITIHVLTPKGWPISFEIPVDANPSAAVKWLESKGYAPATAVNKPEPAASPGPTQGPQGNGTGPAPVGRVTNHFQAETMTAVVENGQARWRVKGGRFQKWGVPIYPETLEQLGWTDLDPLKPLDLRGYVATYTTKEDGDTPAKIIRLEQKQPRF